MSNKNEKKPLYFLNTILPIIISPIIDKLVSFYFSNDKIAKLFETSITLRIIIPVFGSLLVLIICCLVYIFQLKKKKNRVLNDDEMSVLNNKLQNALNNYDFIDSAQVYHYCKKNDNDSNYIKLSFVTGFANERIDINSIMQTYYYIPYSLSKKLQKFSTYYDNYCNEGNPMKKAEYQNEYVKIGNDIIKSNIDELNKIVSPTEIKKYQCEIYRIVLVLYTVVTGKGIESILINEEVENELRNKRKTGLLGSVVINNSYLFKNMKSTTKFNRFYLSFPYNEKKGIVVLLSINGSEFDESESNNFILYFERIIAEIKDKKMV